MIGTGIVAFLLSPSQPIEHKNGAININSRLTRLWAIITGWESI